MVTNTMTVTSFSGISEKPLDQNQIEQMVTDATFGAVVSFVGQVRNHDPEASGEVITLEYSAHPDAAEILAELVQKFSAQNPLMRIAAFHRIGTLNVGDSALIVSIAAAHREDLFDVCKNIVEEIKARVPIWKKQHTASGESHWVGMS